MQPSRSRLLVASSRLAGCDDISLIHRLVKKSYFVCRGHGMFTFYSITNSFLSKLGKDNFSFDISSSSMFLLRGLWCHLCVVLERLWHLSSEDSGPDSSLATQLGI